MSKAFKKDDIVALKELRLNMEKYIDSVSKGRSFTVFRRSEPVFRIAPVDSEDTWETVLDFTKIDKNGVPAMDVLRALKELHGKN